MSPPRTLLLASVFLLPLLSSCDQIAVLDGTRAREADAVAVGSACRHAGRALEDCFNMNPDAPKAQVFAGWKEMNDYMTEKKIDVIAPTPVKPAVKPAPKAVAPEIKTGATEGKAAGAPAPSVTIMSGTDVNTATKAFAAQLAEGKFDPAVKAAPAGAAAPAPAAAKH